MVETFECETAKEVGKRIAELRTEHYLSQEQLADKIGVSRSAIGGWETGTRYPDVDSWIKMSQLFHVSTDYICGTSTQRTGKCSSISDYLDLERLNDAGRHMLFKYYHMLLEEKMFTK